MGRIYLQAGLLDQALKEFNLVSESIANTATPSASAMGSPNTSPTLSRVGSQVSVVSGHLSQGSGAVRGGGGVTQRHKNLVNMNAALMASAQGDWVRAEEILRGLMAVNPGDFVVSRLSGCSFPLRFLFIAPRPVLEIVCASFRSGLSVLSRHHPADTDNGRYPEKRNIALGAGDIILGKRLPFSTDSSYRIREIPLSDACW